jgi:predicted TIM-barrel fold metal-dependent hydrolase
MNERIYFDCSAMIGKRGAKDVETMYATEDLLEEMEWSGIHGALVAHWLGKEYDPSYGNRKLLKELKKSKRLHGVWTVIPHHTGEMPPPRDLIQEMKDNGIRAAKIYPRSHHYPFTEDFCGDLLSAFEDEEILLMVEGGSMYHPDIFDPFNQVLLSELDAAISHHPRLRVLLQGSRWEATRYLYPLMKKHKHLFLEFSNHQANHALENYGKWFGMDRLLLGTGALDKSMGAARSFIDYSPLTDEDKELIAGKNLARLLRVDTMPARYKAQTVRDPILRDAKEGKLLRDTLIIDAHAHISHDGAEGSGFMHLPSSDAASMFAHAKTVGISQMHISSWIGIWADYEDGNQIVYDAMQRFPRFYHGYATLQPQYVKDWKREIAKVHGRYRMGGLKPYYPRTGLKYSHPGWAPWFEYGNRHRLYTLIHPSDDFVRDMNDLIPRYPDMHFILAHQGGSFGAARDGIEIAKKFPNVSLEITLTAVTFRVIEFMVEHIGADRVIFGTDQPMRDPIPQFGWVAYSHCTPAQKKKIFGENMRRIVRRVRW